MWEAAASSNARELSPIPEFDYYHADDESDSEDLTTARLLAKLSNSDLAFEWSMLCQDCEHWSPNGESSSFPTVYFKQMKHCFENTHFYGSWYRNHDLLALCDGPNQTRFFMAIQIPRQILGRSKTIFGYFYKCWSMFSFQSQTVERGPKNGVHRALFILLQEGFFLRVMAVTIYSSRSCFL